jgi:hypothetical protein
MLQYSANTKKVINRNALALITQRSRNNVHDNQSQRAPNPKLNATSCQDPIPVDQSTANATTAAAKTRIPE